MSPIKEIKMSVAQELRTIQANLEARTLELAAANGTITTLQAAAVTAQATIEAQAAQLAEQAVAIDGHAAAVQALTDGHTAATAELTARVAALEAENTGMKTKLSNPAFKLAGIEGEDPKTAGGGGEAGAGGEGSLLAQYKKLTGAAKTKFYRENKAALTKLGA
jgi:chromosome segregation ATPase